MTLRLKIVLNHLSYNSKEKNKPVASAKYLKDPLHFLGFEDLIPADINERRKKLRILLEKEIAPIIPEYVEKAQFPMQTLPHLKGMNGVSEAKYGCPRLSPLEKAMNIYELARIDGSLATFYVLNNCLVIPTIEILGSEEQKATYLPKLCTSEIIGCWGLTEPDFGSDASSLQTTATPTDSGFILNGVKRWIGNAIFSDIMIIWAKNALTQNVEGFIVPSKLPGISIKNIERKLAFRIVQNGVITLENVLVPITARLEKATDFNNGVNVILENSRTILPWLAVGTFAGVYETCVKHLRERIQFGVPLGAFQINQEKLVRILGHFQGAFLMAWRITELCAQKKSNMNQASLVKSFVSLIGREVVRLGREILGGDGIIVDNYVIKAMADMEGFYTYEGTYDVNALIVGRAITGIAAFKTKKNR